ncbi:MAG: TfoX/Sxy family protein [bacterium]
MTTTTLKQYKNIGATIEKRLNEIGVNSIDDLAKIGAANAYKKIKDNYPDKTLSVCYYLYSFQGALMDMHWDDIPVHIKDDLRKQAGIE